MDNTVRWILFGVLLTVNVVANNVLTGWLEIVVSAVAGLGVIAVVIDYLLRGRRSVR
ncbi:hypothetical protein [Actinomadura roseirufa]|uniref:hypothetical protein n=1 Tax=Actinomadura roseirufa TaxID=2094049 RepID=UPI0013F15AFC|nr:hypothetical protein [Actinomadura roseirufa]